MVKKKRNILVGTSGYSYQDWKGPFYPADIKDRDMLAFYTRRFAAVEINFTYYRLPAARTMAAIASKAPRLSYAVKLTGDITHEGKLTEELAGDYRRGVEPMAEAGVLGCLLAQFPWRFKYTPAAMEFLKKIAEYLGDLSVVAEFRNDSWVNDDAFEQLSEMKVGFCNVDEPGLKGLLPATAAATSDVGYFRFHGRNAKKWWRHEQAAERYDYLYPRQELEEWLPRIKEVAAKAKKTYVFMNNHPLGQAVTNAEMMMDLLGVALEPPGDAALF
ncbi:MAG TPA: DUF72 domain-containing protein [bacterium]|nr:DUF72 domain-containing protein [bacterium]